jgi:hypothetical protein
VKIYAFDTLRGTTKNEWCPEADKNVWNIFGHPKDGRAAINYMDVVYNLTVRYVEGYYEE